MDDARTLEQIDDDLTAQYPELLLARRSGGAPLEEAWTRINQLLDGRARLRRVVPNPPDTPPRAIDGPLVSDTKG